MTTVWDGEGLLAVREAISSKAAPPSLSASIAALAIAAAREMPRGPWAPTNKTERPQSGDLHDYMSIGSYWWPCTEECNTTIFTDCSLWKHSRKGPQGPPYLNCTKATGLPYYNHDGYRNPIDNQLDRPALTAMSSASTTLALSGFLLASPPLRTPLDRQCSCARGS